MRRGGSLGVACVWVPRPPLLQAPLGGSGRGSPAGGGGRIGNRGSAAREDAGSQISLWLVPWGFVRDCRAARGRTRAHAVPTPQTPNPPTPPQAPETTPQLLEPMRHRDRPKFGGRWRGVRKTPVYGSAYALPVGGKVTPPPWRALLGSAITGASSSFPLRHSKPVGQTHGSECRVVTDL